MTLQDFSHNLDIYIADAIEIGQQATSGRIKLNTDICDITNLDSVIAYIHGLYTKELIDAAAYGKYANLGIRGIYGKTCLESIPMLKRMSEKIQSMVVSESINAKNYLIPTSSNAVKPIYQLLVFAELRPDGIWRGDLNHKTKKDREHNHYLPIPLFIRLVHNYICHITVYFITYVIYCF